MRILGGLLALAAAAGIAASPSALAARGDQPFTVSSSLDGKKVLPLRSHWLGYTSLPPAQVDRVEFLIDGTVRWVEHHAPFVYAGDENGKNMGFLITTWLKPGLHRFVVRVVDKKGQSAEDAFSARTLAGPAPPPELAGKTWTRTLSLDRNKPDSQGHPWLLWFDAIGEWHVDKPISEHGAGVVNQFDVRGHTLTIYAPIVTGVQQVENGVCSGNGCTHVKHDGKIYEFFGSDCSIKAFGRYTWAVSGDTLTIKLIHDPCVTRQAIFPGTWTRVR
jgi:hypothetical protein